MKALNVQRWKRNKHHHGESYSGSTTMRITVHSRLNGSFTEAKALSDSSNSENGDSCWTTGKKDSNNVGINFENLTEGI